VTEIVGSMHFLRLPCRAAMRSAFLQEFDYQEFDYQAQSRRLAMH
jgi:hypothetical protein